MKQHNIHNDEVLYRQIMAELKPGADEYDALMRNGQNPASKRKPYIIYKYAAAACIAFAIIGISLRVMMSNDTEMPLAQVTTDMVEQKDRYPMAKEEAKADLAMAAEIAQPAESIMLEKAEQAPGIETSEMPRHETETDESEQEFLYALITEVEHRALAEQEEDEQFYRSIIEEVTENMSNATKTPELIL